ncbi:hypothetical protein ABK040_009491 [Willaertia magna]
MVNLTTTNDIGFMSDSNGIIAFYEPEFIDQSFGVWFTIQSDGYSFKSDNPINGVPNGITLYPKCGKKTIIELNRNQKAERLYRVTGSGIYRDSYLTGEPVKGISSQLLKSKFLLNSQVMGQDSVMNVIYKNKYYWFWGDTNAISNFLGNFYVTGGFSDFNELKRNTLSISPNITYFINKENGFVKGLTKIEPLNLPTWLTAPFVYQDKLYACFMKPNQNMEIIKRGMLQWDDVNNQFNHLFDYKDNQYSFPPDGSHAKVYNGYEPNMIYFGFNFPMVKTDNYLQLNNYFSFTPLKANTSNIDLNNLIFDRDELTGKLIYSWKRNTSPLSPTDMFKLVMNGKLKQEECYWLQLKSATDGEAIIAQAGSVSYNSFRDSEGLSPIGPFNYAVKIVTHNSQSFYNPKQHDELDELNGRVIYFEGTYANTFSNAQPTPRYNYNQIMYKLDLFEVLKEYPVPIFTNLKDGFHFTNSQKINKQIILRKKEYEHFIVKQNEKEVIDRNVVIAFHSFRRKCDSCIAVFQKYNSISLMYELTTSINNNFVCYMSTRDFKNSSPIIVEQTTFYVHE